MVTTGNPGHICDSAPALVEFPSYLYRHLIWNPHGTKIRGTIWAADTCQCSWTLIEAMSQHLEQDSKIAESSHSQTMEHHSEADESMARTIEEDNESDHETTDSKLENVFDGIHYPAPHHWEHAYLHFHNFWDPDKAREYINRRYNPQTISKSLSQFPNFVSNFIYSNTYVDTDRFIILQSYIQKSIWDYNAFVQKWLELRACLLPSESLNPFIVANF